MRKSVLAGVLFLAVLALQPAARACSLCGSLLTKQTLRTEMNQAAVVVYGKLANPMLNQNPATAVGTGSTELHVQKVLKGHPALGNQAVLKIKSYIPVLDPKDPPLFVVFADIEDGKLNPNRGRPAQSPALLTYLEKVKLLGQVPVTQRLLFFFEYLDHADDDIATDAFLEFAKTGDKDLADVAPQLGAEKFRKLLLDPKTVPEKIGLFAFMLAAGKNAKDADLLRGMVEHPTVKTQAALDGLLCGYIQLQPKQGWKTVYAILGDKKKTFNDRYAAFRVVRFYYNWKPQEYQAQIRDGLTIMLGGDMADLAIDALRRWGAWELTPTVLGLYGKQGFTAPIMERAIVRYALCCPLPQAKTFVAQVRLANPGLVQEIEQDLKFEMKSLQSTP